MKITYTFSDDDQMKYINTNFDTKITPRKIILVIAIIVFSFLGLAFMFSSDYYYAFLMFAFVAFYLYLLFGYPKRVKKKLSKTVVGVQRIVEITESELTIIEPTRTNIYKLSEIKTVNLIDDYFASIGFDDNYSFVIPKSAFPTKDEMIDFINKIKTNAKIL